MSRAYVSVQLAAQILADAGHRCGYFRTDERLTGSALSVEHIVPVVAGGPTTRENLWRSCRDCNERKGAQTQARDPESGEIVSLYHPRAQRWNAHFRWSDDGLFIVGITPTGRTTIEAL
jgi:5-methylcytosine-specific restriction endonuclease McrA